MIRIAVLALVCLIAMAGAHAQEEPPPFVGKGIWRLLGMVEGCAGVETSAGEAVDTLTLCPEGERMTMSFDGTVLIMRRAYESDPGWATTMLGAWRFDEPSMRSRAQAMDGGVMVNLLDGQIEAELVLAADGSFGRRIRIVAFAEEWEEQSGTWSIAETSAEGVLLSSVRPDAAGDEHALIEIVDGDHLCLRDPRDDIQRTPLCFERVLE